MVVDALNETFDNEKMSNSQRQGVITLTEKEGKDIRKRKGRKRLTRWREEADRTEQGTE